MTSLYTPAPVAITLHKISRTLELEYATGKKIILPAALLRQHSRSAEMRAISTRDDSSFQHVSILAVEPVGNYAIRIVFSDGHRTGIYSWATLNELAGQYQP